MLHLAPVHQFNKSVPAFLQNEVPKLTFPVGLEKFKKRRKVNAEGLLSTSLRNGEGKRV